MIKLSRARRSQRSQTVTIQDNFTKNFPQQKTKPRNEALQATKTKQSVNQFKDASNFPKADSSAPMSSTFEDFCFFGGFAFVICEIFANDQLASF